MAIFEKIKKALKKFPAKRMYAFAAVIAAVFMVTGLVNLHSMVSPATKPDSKNASSVVDYSEFMSLVQKKSLKEVTIEPDRVEALTKSGDKIEFYHGRILSDTSLPKQLNEAGIQVKFPAEEESGVADVIVTLISILFPIVMMLVLVSVSMLMYNQFKGKFSTSWIKVIKKTDVRFKDVAGQEEGKYEVEEIKTFLQNPDAFEATGAKVPRGVLLVGPAGTGKTLLAQAIAGEAGVSFLSVTGSDFSNMFVGVGRDRVETLFKKARKNAPCIVFIDEFDSVARQRGASASDVGREQDTTLNQLLTEMSGFNDRDGIVVMAATNRLDVLDPAAIRPGRFDRHVTIGLPDLAGRRAILEVHVKGKPVASEVDLNVVARGTPGFSGADLQNLVNEAAIFAARDKRSTILAADFEQARDKIIMGAERSATMSEAVKRLTAFHEAGHALAVCLTANTDPLHKVTILPRGRALGLAMQLPEEDRYSVTRAQLQAKLDVLMAGRAAEEFEFGEDNITSGAMSDIEEATKVATNMVVSWGMSRAIGMRKLENHGNGYGEVAEREIRNLIDEAYDRALTLLRDNQTLLKAVAQALLDKETLTGDEVRAMVLASEFVPEAA